LQAIAFIPGLINGIESFFGSHSGTEKKQAAMSFIEAALQAGEAISSREIVDEAKFKAGLSQIIDGTVACLNASTWAKAK
jgi:hypothetical protein